MLPPVARATPAPLPADSGFASSIVRGALAPDAHVGYALPIGGVLGAANAISPMFVGVDIGCRMALSLLDLDPDELMRRRASLFADLKAVTTFGAGMERTIRADHAVLEDERWSLTAQSRGLRAKAVAQLGTSGAGNHFAELVVGERIGADPSIPERFCGLLTHSGSRGVGYAIANHYARLGVQETRATPRRRRTTSGWTSTARPGRNTGR